MNTANQVDLLVAQLTAEGRTKADIVWQTALACVGWPYVFGAWGAYCTPNERHKRYNDSHPTIKTKCPGYDSRNCSGCKWYPGGERVRCFDCRGFTDWCLLRVGIDLIGEGATSQWNSKNWASKGEIKDMPANTLVCLFVANGKSMSHTGFGFNNETVECSSGVQHFTTRNKKWTHWAVPIGLYETMPDPAPKTEPEQTAPKLPTLRKGSKNQHVKQAQQLLIERGYNLGICGADGDFGTATDAAVRKFQKDHGLTVDGVIGPKTWEMLLNAPVNPAKIDKYTVTIKQLNKEQAEAIIKEWGGSMKVEE